MALYRAVHLPARGSRMLGHALTMHETNRGAMIALCACGWVGTRWYSEARARAQHERHVRDESSVGLDALRARAAYVERVAPIIRRPGRFPTA